MTTPHTPSKLEAFMAIFGAALGFSVLFMFALSSFVNMLYDTGSEHASSPMHAAGGSSSGDKMNGSPDGTSQHAKADTAPPPAKTVSIASLLSQGDSKKGAKVAKKMLGMSYFRQGRQKQGWP